MNMQKLGQYIKSYIKSHSVSEIIRDNLMRYLDTDETDYDRLKLLYEKREYKNISEPISYFERNLADLKTNWEKYQWLYHALADDESRGVLLNMLLAKITMDTTYIEKAFSKEQAYFDLNIWGSLENEVFIDCGAFDGDSVLKFITMCPWYKKIHAFEAIPAIASKFEHELLDLMKEDTPMKIGDFGCNS